MYNHQIEEPSCELSEDDMIVINSRNCVIIAMYIKPSDTIDTFEEKLRVSFRIRNDVPTIICGDLNAPLDEP